MNSSQSPKSSSVDPVAGYRDTGQSVLALRADFLAGPRTPEHSHTRAQLALLPDNVLQVRTGRQLWVAAPGQALWIPATLPHQTWSTNRPAMRSLFIRPELVSELSSAPVVVAVPPLLREIIHYLSDAGADEAGSGKWVKLADVAIELLNPLESTALPLPNPAHPKLRRIEASIRATPHDEHAIGYYAQLESMSERSLLRLVVTQTGMNWRQWRRLVILSEALPRLADGTPVGVVAAELGFRSSGSFVTAFRAVFGATPGRFMA